MQRLKMYQRQCFFLLASFWSLTSFLSAQPNLPILDTENRITVKKGLVLVPESRFGQQYYYMPDQLRIKKNDVGNYMFSLMKYVGENTSGTILNAHFSFEPVQIKSTKIQEILEQSQPKSFYRGAYPFYHHKKFYGQFENIDLIMELVEGAKREEFWRHKAALTTTGLVIAANLPKDKSAIIWNALTQNRQQTIEFKIEVETNLLERGDNLAIIFAPLKLKEYLLYHSDSSLLNQANFEKSIQFLLNEGEEERLQVNGDTTLYKTTELNKMIVAKVSEILLASTQEAAVKNQATYTKTRKISRKVTINGKVVEEETITENGNEMNNNKPDNQLQLRADEELSSDTQTYYLGKKQVSYQTYPLYFNLSNFYRSHQTFFKEN